MFRCRRDLRMVDVKFGVVRVAKRTDVLWANVKAEFTNIEEVGEEKPRRKD